MMNSTDIANSTIEESTIEDSTEIANSTIEEAAIEESPIKDSTSAGLDRRPRTERGASLVEYALLIALIALVLFSAVGVLGEKVDGSLKNANDTLAASTAAG